MVCCCVLWRGVIVVRRRPKGRHVSAASQGGIGVAGITKVLELVTAWHVVSHVVCRLAACKNE
jgi:hypothetical protein